MAATEPPSISIAPSEGDETEINMEPKPLERTKSSNGQQTPNVKKFLEEHVLFKGLDDKFLTTLSNALQSRIYNPGEFVVRKGEIGRAMFFVLRGEVEVKPILNVMKEQSFFGEIGVLFSVPRTASCRAYGRCMILALTKERLQRVLQLYPKVAEAISILAEERYASHMKQKQAAMKVDFEDEINVTVTSEDLKKIPLFRDCETKFLHSLALKLNPVQYRQGEPIVVKGEIANEMYFVVQGTAEVFSEENGAVFAEFHPGTFFGEVGIFLETKRIASVRAQSSVITVFKLSKVDLDEVLKEYPEIALKIKTEAKQRFELNQIREKSKLNNTQEAVTEVDVLRETLKQLAMALKLRVFQPNELIIIADEPGSNVVSKDGRTVFGEFRPSSFFGEVALFYIINRTATIRARTLHKDSLPLARTMLAKAEENYKLAIERQKAVKRLQESGETHKFTIEDTIDRLSKVPTFKKTNPNFIRTMAQYTSVHRYKKGEMICKKGDMANEMYFIVSGMVEIVSDDGTKVFDVVQDGGFFGEVGLLRGIARTASVRIATEICDMIQLNKTALETVLNEFPDSFQSIAIEADKRLQQVQTRKMAAENALHQIDNGINVFSPIFYSKTNSARCSTKYLAKRKKRTVTSSKVSPSVATGSQASRASKDFDRVLKKANHIYDVPAGIIATALQYLNPKERAKLRQLSHKFNAIVSDSRCWAVLDGHAIFTTLDPDIFTSLCERAADQLTTYQFKKSLDVSYCGQLKGFGFVDHRWSNLRSLNMTHCKQIGDEQLEKILAQAMRRCIRLTDFGVFLVIRHCRRITSIDLSDCDHVSDKCLKWIASSPSKLCDLRLSFCTRITNAGLYDLSLGNHTFEYLDLSHCQQITDAAIVFFSETIKHLRYLGPSLRHVDFTGCPQVTVTAKKVLQHGLPGITVLIDIPRDQRGVKSPEEAGKPRAVEMAITQVYTSGPKDMGKNSQKKKDKKKEDKKGRKKSTASD
ncbi:cyclic nucleotide-binding-like protein [Obelidium mucronatum]|nr:cyclic nucleotide-binding-like protein [Obelidium mucronatum]